MKNYLLCFASILLWSNSFGQLVKKGSYQFTENVLATQSDLKEKGQTTKLEIDEESKITVLGESTDGQTIYFRYWKYKNDTKSRNTKIYEIPTSNFLKLTERLYRRYKGASVGVYSVPFRLRGLGGGDFDFESSLSLQANLVFGFGCRTSDKSWADWSLGIGLTSVNLNSENSNVTDARSASAFTVSSGLVLKPAEFANIGVFVGWDNLNASDQDTEWKYNGKFWVGLGINISFNVVSTTAAPASGDQ